MALLQNITIIKETDTGNIKAFRNVKVAIEWLNSNTSYYIPLYRTRTSKLKEGNKINIGNLQIFQQPIIGSIENND